MPPPSRTLRAAQARGGLGRTRPSLTAAASVVWECSGRDEKTAFQPNQKTGLAAEAMRTTHPLQKADIFTRHRHRTAGGVASSRITLMVPYHFAAKQGRILTQMQADQTGFTKMDRG